MRGYLASEHKKGSREVAARVREMTRRKRVPYSPSLLGEGFYLEHNIKKVAKWTQDTEKPQVYKEVIEDCVCWNKYTCLNLFFFNIQNDD